ncbi:MAG: carbohydrate ABC transporter permease [Desulfobacteraceae bacterium]|nr:MAG: carbohydrate ABC transporter permease [Desulfobacteraceae bacterium]
MKESHLQFLLKALGAMFLLAFCLLPFGWMVIVSISRHADFLLPGVAFEISLQNFSDVLSDESLHLGAHLRNSLVVSAASAVLAVLAAGLSAYAIVRLRFPGRILMPMLVLAFSMFPQISIVGYLFRLMTALGWINTPMALIFPYTALGLPLALWIMLSAFAQIPVELDKAALIDGASRMQILLRILFPLAAPGALSAALLVFIYSFNEFLFALMLTTDFSARTIPVGIALFEGLHGQLPWGHMMAIAVIAILPVVGLTAVFQRRIVQGIVQGAVKG